MGNWVAAIIKKEFIKFRKHKKICFFFFTKSTAMIFWPAYSHFIWSIYLISVAVITVNKMVMPVTTVMVEKQSSNSSV